LLIVVGLAREYASEGGQVPVGLAEQGPDGTRIWDWNVSGSLLCSGFVVCDMFGNGAKKKKKLPLNKCSK
jgi:hypothetical protein